MASLFETCYRTRGVGIAYNISTSIFGGTAPFLSAYFVSKFSPLFPAYYLIIASLLALPAIIYIPKKIDHAILY